MESIEYLVETPGEAIPHLNMRVFYKHRGVEDRFAGMTAADGVLLAERAEGIASVAHALAFCHAVERSPAASRLRPRAWSGCCTPSSSGSRATSTSRSGWPTRPGSRSLPPGSRCTRSGCCGWSAAVRQPVRPRRGGARRGQRAAAAAARADPRRGRPARPGGHRRRRRADGHLLVPGPAARHRPADAGARPPARGARPDREGGRVRRRRAARPPVRRIPVAGRATRPRALRR